MHGTYDLHSERNKALDFDFAHVKGYATRENLDKALKRLGFEDHRKIICRTVEGKWTAIFPGSNIQGGYLGLYSQHGFMTLG